MNTTIKKSLFLILVTLSLNSFSIASLLPSEAEPDLQLHPETSMENVINEFSNKGGNLIRIDAENPAVKAILFPNDVVYPACSAGFNRSQTLWALLKKFEDKINLFAPHATRYGFDPYNEQRNWHRRILPDAPDEFELWADHSKATCIGFEVFNDLWTEQNPTAEKLKEIKVYYDRNYYGPQSCPAGLRRVYICFDKNTHAILHRLNQANENLKNVVVYHFPLADLIVKPPLEWNTPQQSYHAYEEFSKILLQMLDFSNL